MLRQGIKARAALAVAAALAVIAVLVVVLGSGSSTPARSAAATPTPTTAAATPTAAAAGPAYGPPPLAHYKEAAPHIASTLSVYGVQGQVTGAPTTPPDELSPVSPSSFRGPVAAYRSYSVARLALMQGEIAKLEAALAANDRGAAQAAWRSTYAYYLNLGAVYLEGPIADLNEAIDGTPGGLPGGVSSPQFSGLHRLERGLWTGAPLAGLEPWARKLSADVTKLAKILPGVTIDPTDYATRAHEILEDAVRDQLSGTDAPWSGAGVLGTSAGVVATTEVLKTLTPILQYREGILPIVNADMGTLRTTLASIQRAHEGSIPTTSQLSQDQSDQLDASLGQALEGLAQVPGALEVAPAPVVPKIPAADIKIDP
jgi:high-affinity iron transporter